MDRSSWLSSICGFLFGIFGIFFILLGDNGNNWTLAYQNPQKAELLPPPSEVSIEGIYEGKGKFQDGEEYSILVKIRKFGGAYQVLWMVDDGVRGGTMTGCGVKVDPKTLVVGWAQGPHEPGVSTYKIENNNGKAKLVGKWIGLGMPEQMDETMVILKGNFK